MQSQQSGTVYTQFEIKVSNQGYSNASATTVIRHTPLRWTKVKYCCIRADINLKYQDQRFFFQHWPNKSNFFAFRENSGFKKSINKVTIVISCFF